MVEDGTTNDAEAELFSFSKVVAEQVLASVSAV